MKLYIKEKVFSWGDKFTIKDAYGEDKYIVEGEVFSWGKKLHVYDRNGREVAFIKQEVWSVLARYTIAGLGWEIDGSFMAHEYRITKVGRNIVTISKEWMTLGDSYELDISDPADEIVALAVVITIDCVTESNSGAKASASSN